MNSINKGSNFHTNTSRLISSRINNIHPSSALGLPLTNYPCSKSQHYKFHMSNPPPVQHDTELDILSVSFNRSDRGRMNQQRHRGIKSAWLIKFIEWAYSSWDRDGHIWYTWSSSSDIWSLQVPTTVSCSRYSVSLLHSLSLSGLGLGYTLALERATPCSGDVSVHKMWSTPEAASPVSIVLFPHSFNKKT